MNVKELIVVLSGFDPEAIVVVNGYEGGYTEDIGVSEKEIYLNVYDEWYYGKHGDAFDISYGKEGLSFEKANAVIISR
jgi:hypothetical protein|nr:MAG: hypothetical protein [Caudoviricetes sp.]